MNKKKKTNDKSIYMEVKWYILFNCEKYFQKRLEIYVF